MKPETAKAIGNMANIAELVAKARAAARAIVEVGRPEGGITAEEYAKGPPSMGTTTARTHLRRLANAGEYEIITAMAPGSDGLLRRTQFYRKVNNVMDRIR